MGMHYKRGSVWWIKYYANGRPIRETSGSTKEGDAKRLLKLREGDIEHGVPISPRVGRIRFEEAVADVVNDYKANGKRSLPDLEQRLRDHLLPFFGGCRISSITTSDVRTYTTKRQEAGARNATINRELAALKRAFVLAVQAGKLVARPHIPMLQEDNVRQGFFEPAQFVAMLAHLPAAVQPLARFAYVTGWRRSEVVSLRWSQVDFKGGAVRLEPGTTKNKSGRSFPFTTELRVLLEAQRERVRGIERARGRVIPSVWCWDDGRPIRDFRAAWKAACIAAGCPGRLLHDCRRTAVRAFDRAGISRSVAMSLSGHKTPSTYQRYAIVSEGDLTDAAHRLDTLAGTITGTVGAKLSEDAMGKASK